MTLIPEVSKKLTHAEAVRFDLSDPSRDTTVSRDVVHIGWLWGPVNSGRQGRSRWVYTRYLGSRTYPEGSKFIPVYAAADG